MLNSVHVVAAAAIVTVIPDPLVSLPLAFASHIALDTIPHWNWSPGRTTLGKWASVADGLVAFGLIGLLVWSLGTDWVIIGAGLLSMLPDMIQAPYHFWGWKPGWLKAFVAWERKRQKWPWMEPWVGIVTQIAVAGISLLVLLAW